MSADAAIADGISNVCVSLIGAYKNENRDKRIRKTILRSRENQTRQRMYIDEYESWQNR